MFHYEKIENHRELGFAKAWCDKVLTKLSLGHDSKSNTTDINGKIAYNSMKIDASHSRSSKKIDRKLKTKQSCNRIIIKGKKFVLTARDNRNSRTIREGTIVNDQDSHIDFNDSRLGLNTDILIKKSGYDNDKHNAANDIDIRATAKTEKLGIDATANFKKIYVKHKNSLNQTLKTERNQRRINISVKKFHLNNTINTRSEQEDKIDEDGKILAQNKKTIIDNNIDIATTHVAINLEAQHIHDDHTLKKIRNATVKIRDSRLNLHTDVVVNQTYHSNSAKNDNYIKTQQIKTTATAKGIGMTGSLNIKKEERCKSDDQNKITHKNKSSHIDLATNLPKNNGEIKICHEKHTYLTLDKNKNISQIRSQHAKNIQFTHSDDEFTLGHQRMTKKNNRATLIQDKIAGRLHTKNNIDVSTNLHLKRTHKKSDYHTVHSQQFRSKAELKGDKTAQISLTAERHTENQLDSITGALTSQQRIEAGITANDSHIVYMTANSMHHDEENIVLNSHYGTADYSNGRASTNATIKQITLQDKKNNQKTQGIWAKFCALGYRLFFSGSNSQKLDYSGQPTNRQRQNVSIALSDDSKGRSLNIVLSCTRKKHQGEFKIGFIFRNFLKKCKKQYIFKFSWKKCNKTIQKENDLTKPMNDVNSHKTAANSTIDLSASCHTNSMTTPCSNKKTTHYKGNFKFFDYNYKMEYIESGQYNKNSVDISQQSMNDATMMTSALA